MDKAFDAPNKALNQVKDAPNKAFDKVKGLKDINFATKNDEED